MLAVDEGKVVIVGGVDSKGRGNVEATKENYKEVKE